VIGVEVAGGVRKHQQAAGRQHLAVGREHARRVLLLGHEVHHRHQHQGHRLVEVDQLADGGVFDDGARLAHVAEEEAGVARPGQPGAGVGRHDRVVVDVGDADVRRDRVGQFMGVRRGGDAGADVDDLPDSALGDEAHRTAEEIAVGAGAGGHLGGDLHHAVRGLPVDLVVVPAAEEVVVHPGRVRPAGVYLLDGESLVGHGVLRFIGTWCWCCVPCSPGTGWAVLDVGVDAVEVVMREGSPLHRPWRRG
jgi:hypothetical protein